MTIRPSLYRTKNISPFFFKCLIYLDPRTREKYKTGIKWVIGPLTPLINLNTDVYNIYILIKLIAKKSQKKIRLRRMVKTPIF